MQEIQIPPAPRPAWSGSDGEQSLTESSKVVGLQAAAESVSRAAASAVSALQSLLSLGGQREPAGEGESLIEPTRPLRGSTALRSHGERRNAIFIPTAGRVEGDSSARDSRPDIHAIASMGQSDTAGPPTAGPTVDSPYVEDLQRLVSVLHKSRVRLDDKKRAQVLAEVAQVVFLGCAPAQSYLGQSGVLKPLQAIAASDLEPLGLRVAAMDVLALACRDHRLNQTRMGLDGAVLICAACLRPDDTLAGGFNALAVAAASCLFYLLSNHAANQDVALSVPYLKGALIACTKQWEGAVSKGILMGSTGQNHAREVLSMLDMTEADGVVQGTDDEDMVDAG
eukprot:jgi/Mesvir1/22788/Mv14176-RA.1